MTRTLAQDDFALLRDYLRRTAGLEFDEGRRAGLAMIMHERLAVTGRLERDHGAHRDRVVAGLVLVQ